MYTHNKENSWRNFQADYIVEQKKKDLFFKLLKATAGTAVVLFFIGIIGFYIIDFFKTRLQDSVSQKDSAQTQSQPEKPADISKTRLSQIISTTPFAQSDKNIFFIDTPEDNYKVTTSIDIYLQEYLLSKLERAKRLTRGKPQRIALVVMEADTGRIISMAGFDLDDPGKNPCVESNYPAASIFKIITAAAAVESLGYTPHTQLYFNGNKYTLYKRQLKEVRNKYSYKISFSRAFAESVNPVFGKIGKNYLGKERLDTYADAFGFNQAVNSELTFGSGSFSTNTSEYHLAELGSGFNNDTTISPLFGAMLAASVVNSGNIMIPSIVEHVTGSNGEIIYKNRESTHRTAMKPETAATMVELMKRTVTRGTARKPFRGASRDRVLSGLVIGGKTGSLYNRGHTVKYDWFTGFAKEKEGSRKIALSVVVGHRKYIGTRAGEYAKMILKQYFKKNRDITAQL